MQPVYQRVGLPRADCGPGLRAVPGARRVVGEILYEVGLFGEIGAVPEDGGAGFVNLIFGAAGVGAILEGEAIAER